MSLHMCTSILFELYSIPKGVTKGVTMIKHINIQAPYHLSTEMGRFGQIEGSKIYTDQILMKATQPHGVNLSQIPLVTFDFSAKHFQQSQMKNMVQAQPGMAQMGPGNFDFSRDALFGCRQSNRLMFI